MSQGCLVPVRTRDEAAIPENGGERVLMPNFNDPESYYLDIPDKVCRICRRPSKYTLCRECNQNAIDQEIERAVDMARESEFDADGGSRG
jgi:hypothetical protein